MCVVAVAMGVVCSGRCPRHGGMVFCSWVPYKHIVHNMLVPYVVSLQSVRKVPGQLLCYTYIIVSYKKHIDLSHLGEG